MVLLLVGLRVCCSAAELEELVQRLRRVYGLVEFSLLLPWTWWCFSRSRNEVKKLKSWKRVLQREAEDSGAAVGDSTAVTEMTEKIGIEVAVHLLVLLAIGIQD